ncbi:Bax inhibitor-1 family protein [Lentisphaera profundi]|uniref:Bax inhibitor-1 family protein n=1 Tax=Lentisphaera profundi TaxID=1658616 RepID=A0ABY7VVT7_9BACT|nr:Bax inhibitor-1 family protein [Lentisphaera profundi]WDE96178.1 Bax inhibitor-1 family protein [Lentisphaera profundi]
MRQNVLNRQTLMNEEAKSRFITKTYLNLFGAVMAFMAIESFLLGNAQARDIAIRAMQGSWLLVLGGFMLVSWIATSMARSRSKPVQYAGLFIYSGAYACLFLPLMMYALQVAPGDGLIFKAAMITLSGFIALTGIAFVTRKNFSFLRGFLMWGGVLAMIAIFAGILMGFNLGLWFSVAMVGLSGAGILFTTSNIIHEYNEDDYVGAALELFASLAMMFWYILQIVSSLRD